MLLADGRAALVTAAGFVTLWASSWLSVGKVVLLILPTAVVGITQHARDAASRAWARISCWRLPMCLLWRCNGAHPVAARQPVLQWLVDGAAEDESHSAGPVE